MRKLFAALITLSMMLSLAGCSDSKSSSAAETTAATTTAATTTAAETTTVATTTTAAETTTTAAATQEKIEMTGMDLSGDFVISEMILYADYRQGLWIIGDDNNQMSTPLTKEMLTTATSICISYTCDNVLPEEELALMFKIQHTETNADGGYTKTEYLCDTWYQYGPAGMTEHAEEFYTMPIYADGVFTIPTAKLAEVMGDGDVINQIGLTNTGTAVTGTMNFVITGATLEGYTAS